MGGHDDLQKQVTYFYSISRVQVVLKNESIIQNLTLFFSK